MRHHDGVAGSETKLAFATRVYGALDRVLAAAARYSVVVTHGGAATFLVARWIGMPIEAAGYVKFTVFPGSITELQEDDLFHDHQASALNDVCHLA